MDVPYETARALAATFQLNNVAARAQHCWDAIAASAPESHISAIATLHSLCLSSTMTAAALGCDDAVNALVAALNAAPSSRQAFPAWLALLAFLRHCLASAALPPSVLFGLLVAAVPALVAVLARWSPGTLQGSAQLDARSEVRPAGMIRGS